MSRRLSAVVLAAVVAVSGLVSVRVGVAGDSRKSHPSSGHAGYPVMRCPADMVLVARSYCVDRWEISLVDRKTNTALSPYYPPDPQILSRILDIWQVERFEWGDRRARSFPLPLLPVIQQIGDFSPKAVSRNGVVPQGYLSRQVAREVCRAAGKRLCTLEEWQRACRGEEDTQFPYGDSFISGYCNVARTIHAAFILHGNSSLGHTDPRLNLVTEGSSEQLLRQTGTSLRCVSRWGTDGIYDMVGNIDEWIDDEGGGFVGGFYARMTTKGCDARVRNHPPNYYDYSTGTRCCRDVQ